MDKFWSKVAKTDDHWLWTAAKDRHGYGQVRRSGKLVYAHRLSYEQLIAPIPVGLVIDHLCSTPACVRPTHLEPVPQGENIRRGKGNGNKTKTHCKWGHEFTPENTYDNHGYRGCRACRVAYDKARYTERKR